jgi:hypothetical protein
MHVIAKKCRLALPGTRFGADGALATGALHNPGSGPEVAWMDNGGFGVRR